MKMDLCVLIINTFIGILLSPQVTALRLMDCRVDGFGDFCGFTQDKSDSFDWTIIQWIQDVRRAAPEEPHGYYLSAAGTPRRVQVGHKALLHTPYYPGKTRSILSIRFRLRIDAADGTRMNLYVSQRFGNKAKIVSAVSRGRGWRNEFRNITVSQQFRLSFEAVLGSGQKSSVLIDDIELDIFPQYIQTGPGHKPTMLPAIPGVTGTGDPTKENEDASGKDDRMPMCFVVALVSSSILAVFLVTCVVLCLFALKTNSFTKRSGHQYEVIYSEQSTTQSSMESSLQLSLRRQRHRTATNTSSNLLHRISYSLSSARNSNQSSIYAEIADGVGDFGGGDETHNGHVEVYILGNRSTTGTVFENSFFSTLSTSSTEETQIKEPFDLDIPDKVKEALFLPYIPPEKMRTTQRPKLKRQSPIIPWRAQKEVDTGWVDNIIYEGSFDCNTLPGSGRQVIGMHTLRPQQSPKEVDLPDNRARGFTF